MIYRLRIFIAIILLCAFSHEVHADMFSFNAFSLNFRPDAIVPEKTGQQKSSPQRKRKTSPSKSNQNTGAKKQSSTGSKKNGSTKSSQTSSSPTTSAEAKKQQARTQKEIQQTEAQLRENEAKVTKSLALLGKLDQDIQKTNANISQINGQLGRLNGEIKDLEGSISVNEAELMRLREEYLKAVKKMRVTKKNKSTLAFIFSSKSVSQAMRRMRYLREFSAWRQRHSDEINGKIADLKNQRQALSRARDEQQRALALQKSNETKLASQHRQQEALVAQLKENGQALQTHLQKKQAEARELGNMVSRLIAEEQRKAEEEARRKAEEEERRKAAAEEARRKAEEEKMLAQATVSSQETSQKPDKASGKETKTEKASKSKDKGTQNAKTASAENGKKPTDYADARKRAPRGNNKSTQTSSSGATIAQGEADSFMSMRGKLPSPSTGSFTITSRFGRQNLPDLPGVEFDNPGIDAETEAGASARAVYEGKVSGVYLLPGYNTVVIVKHGNYYTVYGNIANPSVKIGDRVDAGSRLGTLALNDDDTSHSTIHFEVWKNREKLNPQEWLR